MFADDPEDTAPGQYVFSPEDAPHYPGLHNLWSKSWTTAEAKAADALGEVIGTRRVYTLGTPPDPFPHYIRLGTERCIADGEITPPGELPPRDFIAGFDALCYEGEIYRFDIFDRLNLVELTRILQFLPNDPAAAGVTLGNLIGRSPTVSVVPNDGSIFPATALAWNDQIVVYVISGTPNFQVFALECLDALTGPVDTGPYSTFPLWTAGKNGMAARLLAAGAPTDRGIVLVGHSYGAVLAALLADGIREFSPARPVQLATFGMPLPGDRRFRARNLLLRKNIGANLGDPVPGLPPTTLDLLSSGLLVPGFLFIASSFMEPLNGQRILTPAGDLVDDDTPVLGLGLLHEILLRVIAGDPQPPFAVHAIETYQARLLAGF